MTFALHVAANVRGVVEFFRITINITSTSYRQELGDRSSAEFHELAAVVGAEVEHVYQDIAGRQSANVLQFRSVVIVSNNYTMPGGYNR